MTEPERYLVLALSLLVARQRALVRGAGEPYFFGALRQPILFAFSHARGAFRCPLEGRRSELFFSSVLVAEGLDFVSPLSALGPHVKFVQSGPGAPSEVKLSAEFADWLGLSSDDRVYAAYSPLQQLFSARTGFFLPHREPWHAYVGRSVSARVPRASCAVASGHTRVSWPEASFEAAERSGAARFAYESPSLRFVLDVGDGGFDLSVAGAEPAGLLSDLRKFCLSAAMPEGIRAAMEGPAVARIQGGMG